jgi:hypothetical protein
VEEGQASEACKQEIEETVAIHVSHSASCPGAQHTIEAGCVRNVLEGISAQVAIENGVGFGHQEDVLTPVTIEIGEGASIPEDVADVGRVWKRRRLECDSRLMGYVPELNGGRHLSISACVS